MKVYFYVGEGELFFSFDQMSSQMFTMSYTSIDDKNQRHH
jgi:hypothetical protein